MKVLGFNLSKGEIRYSLLTGSKKNPTLIEKERLIVSVTPNVSELMNWFETTFGSIINQTKPNKVAYRLSLEPNKKQIFYLMYPYGVLELLCFKKNIEISSCVKRNFVPTKFDLSKGLNIYKHCDEIFGINKPYWDESQKHSLLSAWLNLE